MHDTFKVLRTSSHTIIICHINCSSVINCKWVRRKVQKVVAALRFVQDEFSRYRCAVFTDVWPGYFLRLTSIQRYFNRNIPAGLARERHLPVSLYENTANQGSSDGSVEASRSRGEGKFD